MDTSKANSRPNPREKANPLSVLLWWWTVRIFKKGYSKVLSIDDLYDPLKKDLSTRLGDRLEKQWNLQLKKALKSKRQPNLLKTIFLAFRVEIFYLGLLHTIIEFVFKLGSPILLGWLLQYFKLETSLSFEEALVYAAALSINNILTVISYNHLLFYGYHLGGQIRIAVCSLVYRKALKLSKTALGETAPGKIVNLVANDVNRFDLVMILLHHMWSAPLSTLIVAYILWREAQAAGIIGISVLMAIVPILAYSGKLSSDYRLRTAIKTDERIRLMDEIISGAQVIKMYAWERPFYGLVQLARKLELRVVRRSSYLRGLFMTFILFTTRIALYCTLVAMLYFGQPLSADRIFVFSSFYNVLSQSMAGMFVRGFAEIAECRVSVRRVQSFMLLEEFRMTDLVTNELAADPDIKRTDESDGNSKASDDKKWSINMNGVTAKWYPESSDNTLEKISLSLEKGKLYVVIGMVGSGKSSLLSTILGEISLVEGKIQVNGSLSYAGQDAWVFGSSVRQNILFGQEFERQRYQRVVKACSLYRDFAQFPEADLSIVGERGSSLSGGQKARINLARAVYRQADIYLLDDPLSAVDAHVGKHLFEECISRYLRGKTRILVTHQLQYIKDVDGIILLDQGKMQYYENYHKLLEVYPEYRSLIAADEEESLAKDVSVTEIELRRRFSSTGSKSQVSESEIKQIVENNNDSRKLEDVMEATSKGTIKGSVFFKYFRSGSNICMAIFMILLFFATQILVSLNDFFVPYIVNAEESRFFYDSRNKTSNSNSRSNEDAAIAEKDLYPTEYYVYVYTAIIISIFVIGLTRALVFYTLCLRSSERLHNSAFSALIRTSLRFFDVNPSGRILNRFSKDTSAMDELLPKAMMDSGQILLMIAGAIVLTCLVNPIFIVPALFIGSVCYLIKKVYLKTSKNIKRLEGITRSPVFTHLNATLNGISTIRAYGAQTILKTEFDKYQDIHTSSWYIYTACSLAFAFSLDLFTFSFVTLITFTFLIFKENFNGGEVGLAITQMMAVTSLVQWGMRQSAEVTNQMMSVERILEYTQIPPEEKSYTNTMVKGKKILKKLVVPPKDWPSKGIVQFQNVSMRYAEKEEPVLKNLNFYVKSSEKIGIVGRTGAGKSSLISALFRLAQLEGTIMIDEIDTGTISLEDLRSRISIIPQDPVLFSGTLRRNLDPFEEFPDEKLWEVLEEVELKDAIEASGLNYHVLDRGANFSVGQRQLICLARAILRDNRILMLDEATANVDPQTDALIQRTIRTKFVECTVFTVAHRLNTIIDSDRVMVMDKGCLSEFDHPYILLQRDTSQFTSLVKETGDAMFQQLFETAKNCYEKSTITT